MKLDTFAEFLKDHQHRKSERQSLFGSSKALFVPQPDQSRTLALPPSLRSKKMPPLAQALEEAESRFGSLPSGYRTFISLLGPGAWANAIVWHPAYLNPLGWPERLAHFVPVASNVDGAGNCLLFDPLDQSCNQKMYFGCHDPQGYALLTDSFEDWIYKITPPWIANQLDGVFEVYADLELIEF